MILQLLILILIITFLYLHFYKTIEGAAFRFDSLHIPNNPVDYDEVQARQFIRIIGIDKHVKLDKYNNIEKITFAKPKPEIGETKCNIVTCPQWIKNIACWKCI